MNKKEGVGGCGCQVFLQFVKNLRYGGFRIEANFSEIETIRNPTALPKISAVGTADRGPPTHQPRSQPTFTGHQHALLQGFFTGIFLFFLKYPA